MKNKILIPDRVFYRIGDVAEILGIKPYVIRFWESEFPFVAPEKSDTGQRVYRRHQIEAIALVKHLLYEERYSIEGAKKKLTELRRNIQLKEAMKSVVQGAVVQGTIVPVTAQTAPVVGDVVSKDKIASLKSQITELQSLIRDPAQINTSHYVTKSALK